MLLMAGWAGMGSTVDDDMNLMQLQAQRHHIVVRKLGEEIDLEIGPGDDDPSFPHNSFVGIPSAKEHAENKHVMDSQPPGEDQEVLKAQTGKRKKKVVKRWREEWADTYKWAYVDIKDETTRIFCSVCREYGRKHRRE